LNSDAVDESAATTSDAGNLQADKVDAEEEEEEEEFLEDSSPLTDDPHQQQQQQQLASSSVDSLGSDAASDTDNFLAVVVHPSPDPRAAGSSSADPGNDPRQQAGGSSDGRGGNVEAAGSSAAADPVDADAVVSDSDHTAEVIDVKFNILNAVHRYSLSLQMQRGLCLVVSLCVCLSVCLSVSHSREPYKTTEPIVMAFGVRTRGGPANRISNGGLGAPGKGLFFGGGSKFFSGPL